MQDVYRTMRQTLRDSAIELSVSIGIAVFPDDGLTPDVLLAHADQALYEAKRPGRGESVRYQQPAAA